MRKKLIIGNWKMNLNMHEASLYLHKLMEVLPSHRDVETVVAPTMLTLQSLSLQVNRRVIKLAAQNCYWRDQGPYTGEVAAAHLRGIADFVLIGHSERRYLFAESDRDIRAKVQAAIRSKIQPVVCIGETLQERTLGETRDVLHDQLTNALTNVTADELAEIVIAYEPVWAIGTGECARPDDVTAAIRDIRRHVGQLFGKKAADTVRVLYGGSITADNAASYLAISGIDGLLMGGTSLKAQQFADIITMAYKG